MFVLDVESMKAPQIGIPSLVSLHIAKDVYSKSREAIYLSRRFNFVRGESLENREAGLVRHRSSVLSDKRTNHVIQGGPEVVDSIPGNQAEIVRNLLKTFDYICGPVGFRVVLGSQFAGVSIQKINAYGIQISDVLIGPL